MSDQIDIFCPAGQKPREWRTLYTRDRALTDGGERLSVAITPQGDLAIRVGTRAIYLRRGEWAPVRAAIEAAEEETP